MKTVYVWFRQWIGGMNFAGGELIVTFDKPNDSTEKVHALVCEAQIAIPEMSEDDIEQLLAGAEIEAIHAAKEELQAKTYLKMQAFDDRLSQLTAIELNTNV